jgi:ketosteroid isomerase-like protein
MAEVKGGSKERVIRRLAEARRNAEFDAARMLITDDVAWHEPGAGYYSGDHRGADRVVDLWRRLDEATTHTFVLEPDAVLETDEHAVARTRWRAERSGTRVEGNEIGVYRFENDKIAEVWFWYDGYDQAAHDFVFTFTAPD